MNGPPRRTDAPIRVALTTGAMPGGGVETYLIKLAHYLQQQGMDVEIVTTVEPGRVFADLAGLGIPAHHLDQPRGPFASPAAHARRVGAFLAAQGYDVVFVNNTPIVQAALAYLPETTVAIPVIHGDIASCYQYYLANRAAWNALIGISPRVHAIAQKRAPGKPILLIPNGIELPTATQVAGRYPWKPELNLLYVGRLTNGEKGVNFLPGILQACRARRIPFHLRLIGEGPDAETLRRLFAEAGLSDAVTFLGWKTHEEVYDAFLNAHITLFPSTSEGFGLVPVEAAACGCVVVASSLPGVTDYTIVDGETGVLVDVGDVDGFAAAIAALHASPERWQRMSDAGRQRAGALFSLDAMGEAYHRVIRDALDGRYPLTQPRTTLPRLDQALIGDEDVMPRALLPLYRRLRRTRAWTGMMKLLGARAHFFTLPRPRLRGEDEPPRLLFVAHDPDGFPALPGLLALMNGLCRAGMTVGFFHAQSVTRAEEQLDARVAVHAQLLLLRDADEVQRGGRHLAYVGMEYDCIVATRPGLTEELVRISREEHALNRVPMRYVALLPCALPGDAVERYTDFDGVIAPSDALCAQLAATVAVAALPLPGEDVRDTTDDAVTAHLPPFFVHEIARDAGGDPDTLLAGFRRFCATTQAPHHLVILGDGPQEVVLRTACRAQGLTRVHLLGYTSWRAAFLRRAAAVIRLTPADAGAPCRVAQAAGTPIIGVADPADRRIPAHDADALAAALAATAHAPRTPVAAALAAAQTALIARYRDYFVTLLAPPVEADASETEGGTP